MSEPEHAVQGQNMQIGQVAERTELSIKTIRHYDEVGLVTPSERTAGGFRLYTEADVQRLLVIRRMKPLGFSLEEMKQLLNSLAVLGDEALDATTSSRNESPSPPAIPGRKKAAHTYVSNSPTPKS